MVCKKRNFFRQMYNSPSGWTLLWSWYLVFLCTTLFIDPVSINARTSNTSVENGNGAAAGFSDQTRDMEKEWRLFADQTHQDWYAFQHTIETKWNDLVYSTRKEWVSYSRDADTRSRVDFEKGEIHVETLAGTDETHVLAQVRSRLHEQLKQIFQKQTRKNEFVLKDQVKAGQAAAVTADNLDQVFERELQPGIMKDPVPIQSKDGTTRQKYRISIQMVPDHLDIRARRYVTDVKSVAERFSLNPGLIMAVIHTESFFNPLAVSPKGAIGLMQVVPKWAGKEAYEYLYQESFAIDPIYLFSPGINLELGTAYLHLLHTRYFSYVGDAQKIAYLAICSYNWGPTALNQQITARYDILKMSPAELFDVLVTRPPQETRNYLQKIIEREKKYSPVFEKIAY
jgi:membrane-bound lytic murein transglycosylase C